MKQNVENKPAWCCIRFRRLYFKCLEMRD